jgi:hypothetical protein
VAFGALLLLCMPYLVSRLPLRQSGISAAGLLARIRASGDIGYSGYAESVGGLALPVTESAFGSLADLLGGRTDLRVWWRAPTDWRVDTVDAVGERDVHQDRRGIWTWDYERNTALRTVVNAQPAVRLPRSDDLVPASLARRLLNQARPAEVSRIADRRIAGHDAVGLRLRPDDPASTIDRVDVWSLSSGLAVRVDVFGRTGSAVISTSMLDLSTHLPGRQSTAFSPPMQAEVHAQELPDLVTAIDNFGRVRPPQRLAGLGGARERARFGSVGVYGRGVTLLVAMPLPPRLADDLAGQLSGNPTVTQQGAAAALQVGPVSLRLTARAVNGSRWLLAGTVTAATLVRAADELPLADGF